MKRILQILTLLIFSIPTTLFSQCFSGTYLIGGSSGNFPTFKAASDSLKKNGICGPVVFKIASGTYSENYVAIPKVNGSSAINTITLEAENKDSASVMIIGKTFIESSNVIIKHLGFSSTSNLGEAISLDYYAENVSIQNCYFEITGSTAISATYYTLSPGLVISNNNFKSLSGGTAIHVYNTNFQTTTTKVEIKKNVIKEFSVGIYSFGGDSLLIADNTIESASASTAMTIIRPFNLQILRNKMKGTFDNAWSLSNIELGSCTRDFRNNFIYSNGKNIAQMDNVNGCGFIFNTFVLTGNKGGAVLDMPYCRYNGFKSNILYSSGNNKLVVLDRTNANSFDYNDYYTNNDIMFELQSPPQLFHELSEWQAANPFLDNYSISYKPQFITPGDFHLKDYNLNNKGGQGGIMDPDLDGETRDIPPDIGADEFFVDPNLVNDAELRLGDTIINGCDNAPKPVLFKLYNKGTAPLTAALIKWTLNSVEQTPYTWTGNIAPGAVSYITIGTVSISSGSPNPFKLIAYIDQANSVKEINTGNDTCMFKARYFRSALAGTYTIGNAANFANFYEAVNTLKKYGICGPVVFNIKKDTYYTYCLVDTLIKGSSATNTITFQSETGNKNDVVIYEAPSFPPIDIFNFTNSAYLNVKNVSIVGSTAQAVVLSGCKSCNFDNNNINGTRILANSDADYKLSFTNCVIGCPFTSNTTSLSKIKRGLTIQNCIFNGSSGLDLKNNDSVLITNNTFNYSGTAKGKAINLKYISNLELSKNYIHGDYLTGIQLSKVGTNTGQASIINNAIIGKDSSSIIMDIDTVESLRVIYNTLVSFKAGSTALNISGDNKNLQFLNNIFSNYGNGAVLQLNGILPSASDYNVFYSKKTNPVNDHGTNKTFSAYKLTSGMEQHSVFSDPNLTWHIQPKLYCMNDTVRNTGTPVASITNDIENKLRDASQPTPGAYESQPDTLHDIIHKDLELLSLNSIKVGLNTVSIIIKNKFIANPSPYILMEGIIDTVQLSYRLDAGAWITEQWVGKLAINQSMNYDFATKLNIPNGKIYKFYVKAKVNGKLIDVQQANDSIYQTLMFPMGGNYTVGGQYPDFTDADTAMACLKICKEEREVKFLFRPGHYYSVLNLYGKDTITLMSEKGDGRDVVLEMEKIHASNITFKKIKLLPNDSAGSNIPLSLGIEVYTDKFTMDSCYVDGSEINAVGSRTNGLSFYSSSNVTITNTNFYGCSGAIVYNTYGNATNTSMGWGGKHEISHNVFYSNSQSFLVQASYGNVPDYDIDPSDSILFHHNEINDYASISLYANNKNVSLKIYDNKISAGVAFQFYDFKTAIPIYNNFVRGSYDASITLTNTENLQFFHNSLYGAVYMTTSKNNVFKNNILFHSEKPVLKADTVSTYIGDYNDFYTNGPVLAEIGTYQVNSLDSLKNLVQQETHSVSFHPYYYGYYDLHSNTLQLKNKGTPSFVKTDIDGQPRNAVAPDIGADEIDPVADVVWPGDANADSKVSNKDLLSIGLYNGMSGLSRSVISDAWYGAQSADWVQKQYNQINMKHADCNGDGKVDSKDTLVISKNFGLTHDMNQKTVKEDQVISPGNDLYFYMKNFKSSYALNDPIEVEIWLGKKVLPVQGAYGISFDVLVPPTSFVAGSLKLNVKNSWLGNAASSGDLFTLSKKEESLGASYVAEVRNNHMAVSGYGKIGTFTFLSSGTSPGEDVFLKFDNVNLIASDGSLLIVNAHNNSITNYKGDIITNIETQGSIGIFEIKPNIISEDASISYSTDKDQQVKMDLYTSTGQLVNTLIQSKQNSGLHTINFKVSEHKLTSGVYFIRLTRGNEISVLKMMVTE